MCSRITNLQMMMSETVSFELAVSSWPRELMVLLRCRERSGILITSLYLNSRAEVNAFLEPIKIAYQQSSWSLLSQMWLASSETPKISIFGMEVKFPFGFSIFVKVLRVMAFLMCSLTKTLLRIFLDDFESKTHLIWSQQKLLTLVCTRYYFLISDWCSLFF